ncbi:hypothetical protein HZS_7793 [Henneguya salminicola]|nr:hypothetical protein HZS_7793 [Henneguya salminicola]
MIIEEFRTGTDSKLYYKFKISKYIYFSQTLIDAKLPNIEVTLSQLIDIQTKCSYYQKIKERLENILQERTDIHSHVTEYSDFMNKQHGKVLNLLNEISVPANNP